MRTQVFIFQLVLSCSVMGGLGLSQVDAIEWDQPNAEPPWDLKSQLPKDFLVKPNYFPAYVSRPGTLLDDGVQRDAFDLQMKSSIPGGLNGEAQLSQSMANSQAERLSQHRTNQLMRFKVGGDSGFLQYGSEYRSVGRTHRPQPGGGSYRLDQEGMENWVGHTFSSWLSIKGTHLEYANNVGMDPTRPRTATSLNGVSTTFTIPSGPSLTLSYMTGTAETRRPNKPGQVQESAVVQYSAAMYYWHERWDVSLSSTMMSSHDTSASDQQMRNVYHSMTMNIRPNDQVWISPSVSYGEDRYSWNGERVTYPMMSLSLYWNSLFNLIDVTSYSSYMAMKSTMGYIDTISIYSITSFIYQLGAVKNERYLSLDFIHNEYGDGNYRQYSINDDIIRLMYTVSRF